MLARGVFSFYPPRLHASGGFPSKPSVSPTCKITVRNSFVSPTYAKTGGWAPSGSKTLKFCLKCRRADILSLFSPNPHSLSSCFSITSTLFHFPYPAYLPPFQYLPHSCPKNRGYTPLWSNQSHGFPVWSDHSFSSSAGDCQLSTVGFLLTPFPASLTQKQGGTPLGHTNSLRPNTSVPLPHQPPLPHLLPFPPFTSHSQSCYPTFTYPSPSLVTMLLSQGSNSYTMPITIRMPTVHFYRCDLPREIPS